MIIAKIRPRLDYAAVTVCSFARKHTRKVEVYFDVCSHVTSSDNTFVFHFIAVLYRNGGR